MPSQHSQNVSLTPELQRFIAERVGSGRYRSTSEVVREALRCLEANGSAHRNGKQAEVALRESEERLRSLTANMPSAMVYQIIVSGGGRERRFSFVAESCERLNGVKAGEVMRDPTILYDMILPEHRQAFVAAEEKALVAGIAFDCEVAMQRPDGVVRWHRISSAPRPGLDGEVIWDGIQVDVTDRVEAEAARSRAVAHAEQLAAEMAAVLGQLAEGVIVTDAAGKLIFVNEAAARIHGAAKLDIAPEHYSDTYHLFTEDGHPYPSHELPLARAVLKGETVTDARWRIRRPDGTEVLAIGTASPLFRPDGTHMGAVLTLRDDTARNAGELKLRRSETLKRAVLEAALDCLVTITDESRIVEWNPAAERTFGYPTQEALGQDLAQLIIPPEFRERHYEGMARYLSTGHGPVLGQRVELEGLRADGSRFPVELAINPISIEGQPHFTAYLRDITERRRTEAALRDSEQRLRATYEHAFVGIAEVDADGRFLRVNEQLTSITGFSREELLERTFSEITHPDERDSDLERFRLQMEGEIKDYAAEKRYMHKDGRTVWIELSASRVDDADGHPLYGVRVVRDISERKRAEQHRELLINELNHRVKNTLATVQSIASQTLRNAPSTHQAKVSLEARLFALARVHDVLTEESWEGANLRDIVLQAIAPYRSGDARFHCRGPDIRLSPRAALALAMALQELATNAVKYGALSNSVGKVSIAWEEAASQHVRLRWAESGGPPVVAPTRRGFGTRLIERGLANDLGGEVTVEFAPTGLVCSVDVPQSVQP